MLGRLGHLMPPLQVKWRCNLLHEERRAWVRRKAEVLC